MRPDEEHSLLAAWAAMTAGEVVKTKPRVVNDWMRLTCSCGGSLVIELTGDPDTDVDRLVDAFSRPHDEGVHEIAPWRTLALEEIANAHLDGQPTLRVVREEGER